MCVFMLLCLVLFLLFKHFVMTSSLTVTKELQKPKAVGVLFWGERQWRFTPQLTRGKNSGFRYQNSHLCHPWEFHTRYLDDILPPTFPGLPNSLGSSKIHPHLLVSPNFLFFVITAPPPRPPPSPIPPPLTLICAVCRLPGMSPKQSSILQDY